LILYIYIYIYIYTGLYVKKRYSCEILMKHEIFRQILEQYSNINFHENPYSMNGVFMYGLAEGRTDRHDEANSHFSQFGERA
jgi:hypothetical protein